MSLKQVPRDVLEKHIWPRLNAKNAMRLSLTSKNQSNARNTPQVKQAQQHHRVASEFKAAMQGIVRRVVGVLTRSIAKHRQFMWEFGLHNERLVEQYAEAHRRAQGNMGKLSVPLGDGIYIGAIMDGTDMYILCKKDYGWNFGTRCKLERVYIRRKPVYKLVIRNQGYDVFAPQRPAKAMELIFKHIVRQAVKEYNRAPVLVHTIRPW